MLRRDHLLEQIRIRTSLTLNDKQHPIIRFLTCNNSSMPVWSSKTIRFNVVVPRHLLFKQRPLTWQSKHRTRKTLCRCPDKAISTHQAITTIKEWVIAILLAHQEGGQELGKISKFSLSLSQAQIKEIRRAIKIILSWSQDNNSKLGVGLITRWLLHDRVLVVSLDQLPRFPKVDLSWEAHWRLPSNTKSLPLSCLNNLPNSPHLVCSSRIQLLSVETPTNYLDIIIWTTLRCLTPLNWTRITIIATSKFHNISSRFSLLRIAKTWQSMLAPLRSILAWAHFCSRRMFLPPQPTSTIVNRLWKGWVMIKEIVNWGKWTGALLCLLHSKRLWVVILRRCPNKLVVSPNHSCFRHRLKVPKNKCSNSKMKERAGKVRLRIVMEVTNLPTSRSCEEKPLESFVSNLWLFYEEIRNLTLRWKTKNNENQSNTLWKKFLTLFPRSQNWVLKGSLNFRSRQKQILTHTKLEFTLLNAIALIWVPTKKFVI